MRHATHLATLFVVGLLITSCASVGAPVPGASLPALPVWNELLSRVELAARPELFDTPWDASPDPDGNQIYFTASGRPDAGLFRVPAGGGTTSAVAVGAPFVSPLGLAISWDGTQVYVADPKAVSADGKTGLVFVVPADGGTPTPLAGSAGTAPRGLEVASDASVYVAGVDPSDGQPAVLRLTDGALAVVAKGAPLVEPVGVASAIDGTLYVVDRLASGDGLGSVFRLRDGRVEPLAEKVRTGTPVAGATLTLDESALLVSALATERDSAQVLVIKLASGEQGVITSVIEANSGSGGVHRAHRRNLFAWADSTLRGAKSAGGGVYALTP